MNPVLEFLNNHVSVRQFTREGISTEDEHAIITTAQRSPTSSNIQAYSIISIRDQERKDALAMLAGNQGHISQSSLFLVFCADLFRLKQLNVERGYAFYGEYTETFLIATIDTALVAGRALLAAQGLGFGGVMVGAIRNEPQQVAELLQLPELVYPVMGMSLGYPAAPGKIKPRLPKDAVCFSERYRPEGMAKEIQSYDDAMFQSGLLVGRQVRAEQYPEFSGRYSWSEHTARRMADNSAHSLRPHMLTFLRQRGFLLK